MNVNPLILKAMRAAARNGIDPYNSSDAYAHWYVILFHRTRKA